MKSLIHCRACGNSVSPDARSCPSCGDPVKPKYDGEINMRDPIHLIGVSASVVFIIGLAFWVYSVIITR